MRKLEQSELSFFSFFLVICMAIAPGVLSRQGKATGQSQARVRNDEHPSLRGVPLVHKRVFPPSRCCPPLCNNSGLALLRDWIRNSKGTVTSLEIAELMRKARLEWPLSYGTFPHTPANFVTTSARLHKLNLWISVFSVLYYNILGFDQVRLLSAAAIWLSTFYPLLIWPTSATGNA